MSFTYQLSILRMNKLHIVSLNGNNNYTDNSEVDKEEKEEENT